MRARPRTSWLDRWFDALSAAARRTPGAQVIDLTPFYCDEDKCPVVIGGVNVYRDNNHLTVTYAQDPRAVPLPRDWPPQ